MLAWSPIYLSIPSLLPERLIDLHMISEGRVAPKAYQRRIKGVAPKTQKPRSKPRSGGQPDAMEGPKATIQPLFRKTNVQRFPPRVGLRSNPNLVRRLQAQASRSSDAGLQDCSLLPACVHKANLPRGHPPQSAHDVS
eukprot:350631-Chlamydomonas_euryale.AAC.7